MTVIAIVMARDEADIIATTLTHLRGEGVDHVIVSDNRSTDDTAVIVKGFDEFVTYQYDDEPGYYQADKMTALARQAHEMGAEWVVPCDADEFFYCPDGYTLAGCLGDQDANIVAATGFDHIVVHPETVLLSAHRRTVPQKLPKVVFRAHPDAQLHMGNHDVELPEPTRAGGLELRHFQYRTLDQMIRKARNGREAYEASNLHYAYGTHWRVLGAKSDEQIAAEWVELCATPGLIYDPAPIR